MKIPIRNFPRLHNRQKVGALLLLGALLTGIAIYLARTHRPHSPQNGEQNRPKIEVLHWLTSGQEAASLTIARRYVERHGSAWQDNPIPSVSAARTTAVSRIVGGSPPGAFQISIGVELKQLSKHHLIGKAPVDGKQLDRVLPKLIADASKVDGAYVAIPALMRGENWMFYNIQLLDRLDISQPRTWNELLQAARKLQSKGITPIAIGNQAWQQRLLFNSILFGTGGADLYRGIYLEQDESALNSPEFLEAFQIMATLRDLALQGNQASSWQEATDMVIRGDAAFQFMGDWAKAEILASGKELGRDVGCVLAPAAAPGYIVAVDAFAFPSAHNAVQRTGQQIFAEALIDREIQRRMSVELGSMPVRTDVAAPSGDPCAKLAIAAVRSGAPLLPSTGLFALPGSLSGAIDDEMTLFWHGGPSATPEHARNAFRQLILSRRTRTR